MNIFGLHKSGMRRFTKKMSLKAGTAPGTLLHVGEKRKEDVSITLLDYDAGQLSERELLSIEETDPFKNSPTTTWVNIDGLHDIKLIEQIGEHFQIHPLTMEDIVNTGQRPKLDTFDNYVYAVFKMLQYNEKEDMVVSEQVSLVIGEHILVSFQEARGDVFDSIRSRIRKGRVRIRNGGSDYLAYALIDAIVDQYFLILEKISERIEQLETAVMDQPSPDTLRLIHGLKRETIYLRKQVWPLREVVGQLIREDTSLVRDSVHVFLKDVYDHITQVIDTTESFRDILSGITDLYLSTMSNRMNEVMKILTIIATIFIPITFVAGIYGMNFKHMPELEWKWGYAAVWMVMIAIAFALLYFFRRKRWL